MMYMATAVSQYHEKGENADWDSEAAFISLPSLFVNNEAVVTMIKSCLTTDPAERIETTALAENAIF